MTHPVAQDQLNASEVPATLQGQLEEARGNWFDRQARLCAGLRTRARARYRRRARMKGCRCSYAVSRGAILLLAAAVAAASACREHAAPRAGTAPPGAAPADAAAARSFYADRFSRRPSVADMTELGRALFADPGLGASGTMACTTCHDPGLAYGPPNARSTQLGGPDLRSVGVRAAPSLRYLQTLPPF